MSAGRNRKGIAGARVTVEFPLADIPGIREKTRPEVARVAVRDRVIGVWRSLVARFVRDEEAVGSNPATPTIRSFTTGVMAWLWHDISSSREIKVRVRSWRDIGRSVDARLEAWMIAVGSVFLGG